jgi:hypothetical protein
MFNLEQAIADWREQMLAAGIKTPVPLEELESHLRDEIERQVKSGLSAQQAFGIAARTIGQVPELKREFQKVEAPKEMQKIIKLAGVICVVAALFCPLAVLLQFSFSQGFSWLSVLALAVLAITIATIVLSWKYNHKLLPVIGNLPLRRSIGIACYGGCLLWIRFVVFHFPVGLHGGIVLPSLIFGAEWTVMAILGGVGYGLEKAATRQKI